MSRTIILSPSGVQYVKDDNTQPLDKTKINYLQRVVGKFLYYAQAIDNTMIHALNDIATVTSKGTEATLVAVEYFLNYAAVTVNFPMEIPAVFFLSKKRT